MKSISKLFGGGKKSKDDGSAARAEQSRILAEQAAENLRENFAQNLANENIGQVVAGGTADMIDPGVMVETSLKKKQKQSLSSTLGINA
jgi:hypothetical protein